MNYDIHDGYIITDTVRIGNSSTFVLGVHLQEANCFATWNRMPGGTYLDKHPFGDLLDAQKDLVSRASAEIEFVERCQEVHEQNKSRKERER